MSSRKLPVVAGVLCFGVSPSLLANTPHDEIVVTANRTAQSIDTILAPMVLIDRQRIAASQASSLYDLLKTEAGVQLVRNGGRASATSLFLRGTNDDHTLILIDGVRAGSATLGTTALESLSLDQIERIEIVKGPRSSLYGADAIGGVIQIFTRNPVAGETVLSVAMGTHRTRKTSLSTAASYDSGAVAVSASRETSDGYDLLYSDDQSTGNPVFDSDDDEYELRDVSLRWNHRFSERAQVTWSNLYSEDESYYDTAFVPTGSLPYSVSRNVASSVLLDLVVSEHWGVDLKLGFAEDNLINKDEFITGPGSENQIETERYDYSVTNRIDVSDTQKVVAGLDYTKEQVEPDYAQDERENLGTFAQYLFQSDAVSFSLGARYDDSDSFASTTTGDIAVGYVFAPALEVIVSHGTAFKAPTFNDLFWPASDSAQGNPDIQPEESKNTELQLRGDINVHSSYQFSLFYNQIENLIDWRFDPSLPGPWGGKYTPSNVADARIRGAELAYHVTLDSWQFGVNSSYIEPKDRTANEDLVRRARTSGSLDISRQEQGYIIGLTLTGKGQRKGDPGAPGGYATVDIRFERQFTEALVAKLKIDNLFNRQFISVPGYNDIGRFAMLELQYRFAH